jgi:hypothetical protein
VSSSPEGSSFGQFVAAELAVLLGEPFPHERRILAIGLRELVATGAFDVRNDEVEAPSGPAFITSLVRTAQLDAAPAGPPAELASQVRAAFGVERDAMTPWELCRKLLGSRAGKSVRRAAVESLNRRGLVASSSWSALAEFVGLDGVRLTRRGRGVRSAARDLRARLLQSARWLHETGDAGADAEDEWVELLGAAGPLLLVLDEQDPMIGAMLSSEGDAAELERMPWLDAAVHGCESYVFAAIDSALELAGGAGTRSAGSVGRMRI